MQWFENAYDRAELAEYVLREGMHRGLTEEYADGFRRTSWSAPSLGALAIMNHQPYRKVYSREVGYDEPVPNPYFRVQLSYRTAAEIKVHTLIEFDHNFSYLKRSEDYTRQPQPEPSDIWDEAMAALDESLMLHAIKLGSKIMPAMIVRSLAPKPAEQPLLKEA